MQILKKLEEILFKEDEEEGELLTESKKLNLLEEKINDLINNIEKNNISKKMIKSIVEKMAIWYEFTYSDYEIINIDSYKDYDKKSNIDNFLTLLSDEEKMYFKKEKNVITKFNDDIKIKISENGVFIIKNGKYIQVSKDNVNDIPLNNLAILLEKNGINLADNNNLLLLLKTIRKYYDEIYLNDQILNCVMYRIIERGGNNIGPRRGLLFAKEFARNKEIPIIYGIDLNDSDLFNFINAYFDLGGTSELICYVNYFNSNKIKKIKLSDLLKEDVKKENYFQKVLTNKRTLRKA